MARVEAVLLIRLSGAGFHDLREFAREKGWGVSDGQLYRYQQQADDLIRDSLERDRPHLLDLHVSRRRTLYARCVESGDWRAALAVIDSEAKILGMLRDRLEVSGPSVTLIGGVDGDAALGRKPDPHALPAPVPSHADQPE